jgi:hypothetical protein
LFKTGSHYHYVAKAVLEIVIFLLASQMLGLQACITIPDYKMFLLARFCLYSIIFLRAEDKSIFCLINSKYLQEWDGKRINSQWKESKCNYLVLPGWVFFSVDK